MILIKIQFLKSIGHDAYQNNIVFQSFIQYKSSSKYHFKKISTT